MIEKELQAIGLAMILAYVPLTACDPYELPVVPQGDNVEQYEVQARADGLAHLQVDGADDLEATSVTCWRKLFTPDGELHSLELLHGVWIWAGGFIIAETEPDATVLVVVVRHAAR